MQAYPRMRLPTTRFGFVLVASCLLLAGAGCDWGTRVTLPFKLPVFPSSPEAVSLSVPFRIGLKAELRPTTLGVTGTVDDLLGQENERTRLELREDDPASASLGWERETFIETEASKRARAAEANLPPAFERKTFSGETPFGLVSAGSALFLPAFWSTDREPPSQNSGAWLSRATYRALVEEGAAEVRLGVGDERLAAIAGAVQAFNALAARLGASSESAASPSAFRFERSGEATFPVRIDGRVEFAAVVTAKSGLADLVVLKNPENPLVLKITFNPLALGALTAFSGLGVDPARLGYEITSLERP